MRNFGEWQTYKNIKIMQIILASSSSKRKEILKKAKIPFKVVIPKTDEGYFNKLSVEERVKKIAQAKAREVAKKFPKDLVISADTLDEDQLKRILQKPKNFQEALKMAMEYSGRKTTCYTGVCLIHPKYGEVVEVVKTEIKMQKFTKEEMEKLIDKRFLLRAGALGISEETAGYTLVESICGSYTGFAGLPMEIIRKYLRKWKVVFS